MLQKIRLVFIFLCFLFLAGCATQNIPLSESFWNTPKQKVIVTATKLPKPQIALMGTQGLLDYAINSAMNKQLDEHLSHTDLTWYRQMPMNIAGQLRSRHINTKAYAGTVESDQDYSTITNQFNSDKILVVKLNAVGAKRDYFGFIPTGAPQAYCNIIGELTDTQTKQVLWRHSTNIALPVQGEWDQPPNYPNLTNAMIFAIRSAQEELVDSFFSGH